MGFGVTELLIILAIVLLLFGGRKLKSLGTDLGGAIKGFRKAMKGEAAAATDEPAAGAEVNQQAESAPGDKKPPSS